MSVPMDWSLREIAGSLAQRSGCEYRAGAHLDVSPLIQRVQTDSRLVEAGDLFVCLQGERFDAHDFAADVAAKGALALVVERPLAVSLPQLLVSDCRKALGDLGHAWRMKFQLPVAAVVGSNGKTTTKEMLRSILMAQLGQDAVCWTQGNLNNELGVPMTLLTLRSQHRGAVIEMGMNHPGEIEMLAELVRPDVVLLTNAQREHQEFMKDVESVALENGSAFKSLPATGVAVFPAGTPFDGLWKAQAGHARCIRFGGGGEVGLLGDGDRVILRTHAEALDLKVRFLGRHNLENASGAAAAGLALGCGLDAVINGLTAFEPVKGRLNKEFDSSRWLLINDSYNANPDSVLAAIDVLADLDRQGVLVLGDMGEVGDKGPEFHREVGLYAAQKNLKALWTLGDLSAGASQAAGALGRHFGSMAELIEALENFAANIPVDEPVAILVKGSRFMRMERAVEALKERLKNQDGGEHAA